MSTVDHRRIVAIVALGQLGASLAMRCRAIGCRVLAVARRRKTLDTARARGIIDDGSTDAAAILPAADLTVLCLPLEPTIDFVREHAGQFRRGAMVTDIGSAKGRIVEHVRPLLTAHGVRFIGSHPMAGSEARGLDAAAADLYRNATVFLTPTASDPARDMTELEGFWREVGAVPVRLDAARHDLAAATVSHQLHLISGAIVSAVLGRGDVRTHRRAAAGGFRDVGRIAAADVDMWLDVCRHNRKSILQALDGFESELAAVRGCLEREDWAELRRRLDAARARRDEWFSHYRARRPSN